jgi:hypothetical protein
MLRKKHLATVIAIAISAGGTIGSVYAGGFGGFSGGSGRSHGGGHQQSGGSSFSRAIQSHASNAIRSNFNHSQGNKVVPKNTGIAGGFKLPINGSTNGTNKAPTVGNVISNNLLKNTSGSKGISVIQSSNALKTFSDKMKSPTVQAKVLGGIGIGLGVASSQHHNNHGHHGHNHNHHNHHHHCPPLVFTLPPCQPSYCPPPCPPIYYPVPVAVPVPAVDPNAAPFDPNAVPAAEPMGLPMETQQALEDVVATEAPTAEVQSSVQPAVATTEVVSKELPLPQIPVGATLTLQGKDLTDREGQVVLQLGEIALPATIKEWKNDSVTCTLPVLGLTKASKATLHVLKADGKTASTLNCELVTTLPTSIEARSATTADIEAAKYEQ